MASSGLCHKRDCVIYYAQRCCQVKANGLPRTVEPANSGRQLAPLGQGGGTVLSEDVVAIEVTVLIEMTVD